MKLTKFFLPDTVKVYYSYGISLIKQGGIFPFSWFQGTHTQILPGKNRMREKNGDIDQEIYSVSFRQVHPEWVTSEHNTSRTLLYVCSRKVEVKHNFYSFNPLTN